MKSRGYLWAGRILVLVSCALLLWSCFEPALNISTSANSYYKPQGMIVFLFRSNLNIRISMNTFNIIFWVFVIAIALIMFLSVLLNHNNVGGFCWIVFTCVLYWVMVALWYTCLIVLNGHFVVYTASTGFILISVGVVCNTVGTCMYGYCRRGIYK